MKFWLDRGVDGFRLDTVNFYFHDQQLRDNPPFQGRAEVPPTNPYGYQQHLYDKNRPENLAFLKRLRALMDQYPGSTTVGEIGDGSVGLDLMQAYTSGGDKLHMCYTFDFLVEHFSAEYFRSTIQRFEAQAADSWPCWAFSNHDVPRHVTRWGTYTREPERLAKLMVSLMLSLRGSVSLHQGEELGLHEADVAFEDLVDPYGIRFWPEFKGRDGCRTPMVWESDSPKAGFTTGKPWLPVPADHLPLAVDRQVHDPASVQQHYRRFIHFRRAEPLLTKGTISFVETEGEVVAFTRELDGQAMLCAFNLGQEPVSFAVPEGFATAEPVGGLGLGGTIEGGRVLLGGQQALLARLR
jgi:alpha-glucosidase